MVSVDFGEALLAALLDSGSDDGVKGSAGYAVAAPVPGPRSNAAAEPTQVLALDYDDAGPEGPDWAALAAYRYVAYTTDSHSDTEPRWRVWVLLDRAYSREEVADAACPWAGCHLRAISQPVYLPTRVSSLEWRINEAPSARPLRLTAEWGAPGAGAAGAAWTPPTRKLTPSREATNALVTRWVSRPEGTNRLAGATGAALAEWGWSDEEVAEYLTAWLGEADARFAKHLDDALRGARKRRAGDRIVGFPTLEAELGRPFEAVPLGETSAEELWALVEAEAAPSSADPAPAPGDEWGWEYGAAIAAWDPPPVPWLCEALCLAPGAPGLITGYGGSGKTTFVQHLALCVAAGRPLLGEYAVRTGAVTHIDYEQGADLTRRRYLQLGLSDLPAEAQARLRFRSFPQRRLGPDPETFAALLRAARGQALLIVDSLVASGGTGEDENAAAAREQLDVLTQVSELTGAVVLVIHHSKKDRSNGRTSARGSSAITDAVSVHMTYEKDDDLGATSPATLSLQKVRHILPAGALAEPITVGQSGAGALSIVEPRDAETEQNERLEQVETELVNLLASGWRGGAKAARIELKRKGEDLSTAIKRLKEAGLVDSDEEGLYLKNSERN